MNFGGFSWKRLFGISAFKSKVSREIGIPLTASGRRRKLGATVFNAVGPVAGTLAVAAVGAAKQQESNHSTTSSESQSRKGVYFCEVKGVTHDNQDGTSRIAAQHLCAIGDTVELVPEPNNEHDHNAIRVVLQTGQQIGYISARQASRFTGKIHLLSATVYSRVKDEWGNDTVKLRVLNSAEGQPHAVLSQTAQGQSLSLDAKLQAIRAEAEQTAQKEGWQSTLIYFENAERGLYQIVLAENTDHMRQTLEEGLIQVGFVGVHDEPKGIKFGFALNDGLPTDGEVAKRFVINAREWVATRAKNLCDQNGVAPPVVHDFEFTKPLPSASLAPSAQNVGSSISTATKFGFGVLIILAGLLLGLMTGKWGIILVAVAFVFILWRLRQIT